jgi:molybdopterin-guanine dinucleotide biosynthesis protein A
MNFSAVILAGGRSSRMGRDKAWPKIDSQTLLARQITLVRELGAVEIFIFGRAEADYAEDIGAIPCANGNTEPIAAFYSKAPHSLAESLLPAGNNAMATFAEHCVQSGLARFVELDAWEAGHFTNWNSPADLASMIRKVSLSHES